MIVTYMRDDFLAALESSIQGISEGHRKPGGQKIDIELQGSFRVQPADHESSPVPVGRTDQVER